jgi:hypothetical protein
MMNNVNRQRYKLARWIVVIVMMLLPASILSIQANFPTSSTNFDELGAPVVFASDITLNGAESVNYSDGYIEFSIINASNTQTLGLVRRETPITDQGVISWVGDSLFIGDGGSSRIIGSVNATLNGANGVNLRINFSSSLVNAQFTQGSGSTIPGWTVNNQQVYSTGDSSILSRTQGRQYVSSAPSGSLFLITGPSSSYTYLSNRSYNSGATAFEGVSNIGAIAATTSMTGDPTFTTTIVNDANATGGRALRLFSNGWVNSNFRQKAQYASAFGPEVFSSPFTAFAGDTLALDWRASGAGDDYEVYGYIQKLDANDQPTNERTLLFYGRGGSQPWTTSTGTIPSNGRYRFHFINGSYDFSGGGLLGAEFFIDNIRITGGDINNLIVNQLFNLVTYQDSSVDPVNQTTVNILRSTSAAPTPTKIAEATITLSNPLNHKPTLSATALSDRRYVENDNATSLFSNTAIDPIEAGQKIKQLQIQVSGVLNGAAERLVFDGLEIALIDGQSGITPTRLIEVNVEETGVNVVRVTLNINEGLDASVWQTLINQLSFKVNQQPNPGVRSVALIYIEDVGPNDVRVGDPEVGNARDVNVSVDVMVFPRLFVIAEDKAFVLEDGLPPLTARLSGFLPGESSADVNLVDIVVSAPQNPVAGENVLTVSSKHNGVATSADYISGHYVITHQVGTLRGFTLRSVYEELVRAETTNPNNFPPGKQTIEGYSPDLISALLEDILADFNDSLPAPEINQLLQELMFVYINTPELFKENVSSNLTLDIIYTLIDHLEDATEPVADDFENFFASIPPAQIQAFPNEDVDQLLIEFNALNDFGLIIQLQSQLSSDQRTNLNPNTLNTLLQNALVEGTGSEVAQIFSNLTPLQKDQLNPETSNTIVNLVLADGDADSILSIFEAYNAEQKAALPQTAINNILTTVLSGNNVNNILGVFEDLTLTQRNNLPQATINSLMDVVVDNRPATTIKTLFDELNASQQQNLPVNTVTSVLNVLATANQATAVVQVFEGLSTAQRGSLAQNTVNTVVTSTIALSAPQTLVNVYEALTNTQREGLPQPSLNTIVLSATTLNSATLNPVFDSLTPTQRNALDQPVVNAVLSATLSANNAPRSMSVYTRLSTQQRLALPQPIVNNVVNASLNTTTTTVINTFGGLSAPQRASLPQGSVNRVVDRTLTTQSVPTILSVYDRLTPPQQINLPVTTVNTLVLALTQVDSVDSLSRIFVDLSPTQRTQLPDDTLNEVVRTMVEAEADPLYRSVLIAMNDDQRTALEPSLKATMVSAIKAQMVSSLDIVVQYGIRVDNITPSVNLPELFDPEVDNVNLELIAELKLSETQETVVVDPAPLQENNLRLAEVFDINLIKTIFRSNGETETRRIENSDIQGFITIRLPIDSDRNAEGLSVVFIDADGRVEFYETRLVTLDGARYLEFETDHFSFYAIVEPELATNAFNWWWLLIVLLLIGVSYGLLKSKHRWSLQLVALMQV